jgi:hypothetical protein
MTAAGSFYLDVVMKSRGMVANDRLHSRSYLTNILTMNAHELMQAIEHSENSQLMMYAFQKKNEGANTQIHREVNRLVHNYVCSVATFADHSRNFMNEHYKETRFNAEYQAEVQRRFNAAGYPRFVRDLRNFITHRDLPDSTIELHATKAGDPNVDGSVPVTLRSGIYYKTDAFLEWDGWTSPARRFLENSKEKIYMRELFAPHIELMREFDEWFVDQFNAHHKEDFEELEQLQAEYERLEKQKNAPTA